MNVLQEVETKLMVWKYTIQRKKAGMLYVKVLPKIMSDSPQAFVFIYIWETGPQILFKTIRKQFNICHSFLCIA